MFKNTENNERIVNSLLHQNKLHLLLSYPLYRVGISKCIVNPENLVVWIRQKNCVKYDQHFNSGKTAEITY